MTTTYVLDCSGCVWEATERCHDCIVSFLIEREAVALDAEDVRAIGVLAEAGLIPPLRALRAVS
ncbi:MAG: hypothetical protein HYU28_07455 [Actinobacteria bacterium]|nr:hypothetical protein [Actinomycetota bacterium]